MAINSKVPNFKGLRGHSLVANQGAFHSGRESPVPLRRLRPSSKSGAFQFASTQDHSVLLASVRCVAAHRIVVEELEVATHDDVAIEDMGVERFRAIVALAMTQSKGIDGILLKKSVLTFVSGSYEESCLLLRSCLLDCDRVIGSHDRTNAIEQEPVLTTIVAHVFDIMHQLLREMGRYDECEDDTREMDRLALFSIIENLTVQLEAAIEAVAKLRAETLAGVAAKLAVFDMCDQYRGGEGLLLLKQTMFRDFDRLLQRYIFRI